MTKKTLRRVLAVWSASFVVAFLVTFVVGSVARAYEFSPPFKWEWDETDIVVEDRGYEYQSEIIGATVDYGDDDTDIDTTYSTSGSNIIHLLGDYEGENIVAFADPMSHSTPCFDEDHYLTGDCDTSDNRVDFAYIYWNTGADPQGYPDFEYPWTSEVAQYISRHEMGHVFGFAHPPPTPGCSVQTVMLTPEMGCSTFYIQLTSHDNTNINNKY